MTMDTIQDDLVLLTFDASLNMNDILKTLDT